MNIFYYWGFIQIENQKRYYAQNSYIFDTRKHREQKAKQVRLTRRYTTNFSYNTFSHSNKYAYN